MDASLDLRGWPERGPFFGAFWFRTFGFRTIQDGYGAGTVSPTPYRPEKGDSGNEAAAGAERQKRFQHLIFPFIRFIFMAQKAYSVKGEMVQLVG